MRPLPGWGLTASSSAHPHQEPKPIVREYRELERPNEFEALPVDVQVSLPSFALALVNAFPREREHPTMFHATWEGFLGSTTVSLYLPVADPRGNSLMVPEAPQPA